MTPLQRLSAIAKVLDRYPSYDEPELTPRDFRKLKQLAKPKKNKRKGKR